MNTSRLFLLERILLVALFILAAGRGRGQTHNITYRWLNQPCADLLNCEGGCTACNLPEDDAVVFGTNAAIIGVDACPYPIVVGDNALLLSGWGAVPDSAHRIVISAITQVPLRIDSVIIVHRSEVDGPTRVVFSIKDLAGGGGETKDLPASTDCEHTVLTNAGEVGLAEGASFGSFQLQLQAYGGEGGAWVLDEVHIVTTPINDLVMGIAGMDRVSIPSANSAIDLLGRAVNGVEAKGMAIRTGRTVIVP